MTGGKTKIQKLSQLVGYIQGLQTCLDERTGNWWRHGVKFKLWNRCVGVEMNRESGGDHKQRDRK